MRNYHIAVLPADGIGSEVIPAGVRVLEVLAEAGGEFRVDSRRLRLGFGVVLEARGDDGTKNGLAD